MTPSANRCSILLCTQLLLLAVQSPELVLDFFPHRGQVSLDESESMHCLQNKCPQMVETGSFTTA